VIWGMLTVSIVVVDLKSDYLVRQQIVSVRPLSLLNTSKGEIRLAKCSINPSNKMTMQHP
jgi:hypothetical protein